MQEKNKIPLAEYPRPNFVRDSYLNLNGVWNYKICKRDASLDYDNLQFDGEILVPFSPESKLSGVNRTLKRDEKLIYNRKFNIEESFNKGRVFINFFAVDQTALVLINNKKVGFHEGGFSPFTFEITEFIQTGENTVAVICEDDSDKSTKYTYGKQKEEYGQIWYTPQSGIYFPVFIESTFENYIQDVKFKPIVSENKVVVTVKTNLTTTDKCTIEIDNKVYKIETNKEVSIILENPRYWTLEDPYLYFVKVKFNEDEITSYFGFRSCTIVKDKNGYFRLALNGKIIYQVGILDQGYYGDGLLTPRSYKDYENDLNLIKRLGFNMVRKHIKLELPMYYYLCDKLGIIVWQDFVNGGNNYKFSVINVPMVTKHYIQDTEKNYSKFGRKDESGRKMFVIEAERIVNVLYNHPSVFLYTIFNEGWGQFDSVKMYDYFKKLDDTRIYDHASGWHDQGVSEVKSVHCYFMKYKNPKRKSYQNRALVLSEFGGYKLEVPGHIFSDKEFGYKSMKSSTEFMSKYMNLIINQLVPSIKTGLSASVYTELSDVQEELNGFVTYDREVVKFDEREIEDIANINRTLIETLKKCIK